MSNHAIEQSAFAGRSILLGVTASIAAYKAADLCSRLVRAGADVRVLMTPSAVRLVGAVTFGGLCHRPPAVDMFQPGDNWEAILERAARPADLYIIAPCTADALARIAAGMADDFVTAAALAATCPVLLAPAMATPMWENPRTRRHAVQLAADGLHFAGPAEGRLASGRVGAGRMAEVEDIVEVARTLLQAAVSHRAGGEPGPVHPSPSNFHLLVTAGPTQEAMDPVRMLTNRSTGRMGIAVAEAAAARGWSVTLVLGPTHLPDPPGVSTVRVTTAQEMRDAAMAAFPRAEIVVATAAVSDYRPSAPSGEKLKKTGAPLTLTLERTPDILAEMGRAKRPGQVLIGFAAETRDVTAYAAAKLADKNLDAVVANDITAEGAGFAVDTNVATLLTADGATELGRMTKRAMAEVILDAAARMKDAR
jgi:phosphopantothenoylcysteine decarboxylase/phosphopantothenate--cysteine ligase